MTLLAIESSCDETSAAVVRSLRVLSNVVSSQIQLHAEYGGVVPELATRAHLKNLLPVSQTALAEACVAIHDLDAVAGTLGPGLPNALIIGTRAAQAAAFVLGKPFIGIHHHEAHLYSAWIQGDPPTFDLDAFRPHVALIVSGGHTLLLHAASLLQHRLLGSTLDDAAGECFDKVAKMIGLPYPGGPILDQLAQAGNPRAHAFPRPLLRDSSFDFSFSGLKTSVRYFLRDHPDVLENAAAVRDLCASVQAAIVEVLVEKSIRAAKSCRVDCVTASGGVSRNTAFRSQLPRACDSAGLECRIAIPSLCTDNAAMIGILAELKLTHGTPPTSLDAEPFARTASF